MDSCALLFSSHENLLFKKRKNVSTNLLAKIFEIEYKGSKINICDKSTRGLGYKRVDLHVRQLNNVRNSDGSGSGNVIPKITRLPSDCVRMFINFSAELKFGEK